ncbi:MAG: BglG family transcription antiterminator [Eubacteriales bacterium]|nr:BglG family transcription antiterminator [Eubacteriales bacterium]
MSSTTKREKHADKKEQLTSRQKDIIQILTKFTASRPATVAMISEMLGLSSRTILREIPHVEKWLTQNDFHFVRKPGVGLILDESVENQKLILELLEVESVSKSYSKEERCRRILGELLYAEEPLKSYYFTSKFHISEGTFSGDLDRIIQWLKPYRIELIRRPGLGILLEGEESSYRQAIANLVYESVDESQIMQMLRGEQQENQLLLPSSNRVLGMLDSETAGQVEQILLDSEKRLHIRYADSAYVGLVMHISLAIKRIQNNEKIVMEQERLQKLMRLPEFAVAEEIGDKLKEQFHIKIPRGEIGFITMHLCSARIWPTDERTERNMERINLQQLASEMVGVVEQEMSVDFSDNDSLLEDLCNHFAPMLSRLSMHIPVENPQKETIKEEYPDIWKATLTASDVLARELELSEIPESEISFLAMHFGAAVEKKLQKQMRISVVVVCPTGVGTSRILEAGLKKTFPQIDVQGTVSAFRIQPDKLREQGIDLIISTVNLQTDYPWIAVSPILQAQDKRRIESKIASLGPKSKADVASIIQRPITRDRIQSICYAGVELIDLLDHLRFDSMFAARTRAEVIERAGALFAEDEQTAAYIENGLFERDQLADTYVKQLHVLLLHCQTSMVEHARFGYIKLEPPLYENGRIILGAVVMLVPERREDNILHQLIGALSALLVEDKKLLERLRAGDWDGSKARIEDGLGVYYKQFLKKMGGV